jgi:hypothetical protein
MSLVMRCDRSSSSGDGPFVAPILPRHRTAAVPWHFPILLLVTPFLLLIFYLAILVRVRPATLLLWDTTLLGEFVTLQRVDESRPGYYEGFGLESPSVLQKVGARRG